MGGCCSGGAAPHLALALEQKSVPHTGMAVLFLWLRYSVEHTFDAADSPQGTHFVPTILLKVKVRLMMQEWVTRSQRCSVPLLLSTANSAFVGCVATSTMPVMRASSTTWPLRLDTSNSSNDELCARARMSGQATCLEDQRQQQCFSGTVCACPCPIVLPVALPLMTHSPDAPARRPGATRVSRPQNRVP